MVFESIAHPLLVMQLDAGDALYDIWYGDYDYTSDRDRFIDYGIDEMRTCRGA